MNRWDEPEFSGGMKALLLVLVMIGIWLVY
jgi:hypothetical protein